MHCFVLYRQYTGCYARTDFRENDQDFPRKLIEQTELIKRTVIYFTAYKIPNLIQFSFVQHEINRFRLDQTLDSTRNVKKLKSEKTAY